MNARRHTILNIVAVGVVTTVLMLTALFWARTLCATVRHNWLSQAAPETRLHLSRLLPWEQTADANLVTPSTIIARTSPFGPVVGGLGVTHYVQSRLPMGSNSHVFLWRLQPEEERIYIYFDPTLGQIVYQGTKRVLSPGKMTLTQVTYYAGPEGVARAPEEKLGRFVDPIVDRFRMRPWVLYDCGLARFFAVDWTKQTIRKGPELPQDGSHNPVQIGVLEKNTECLHTMFAPAGYRAHADDREAMRAALSIPNVIVGPMFMSNHTPVLDASGRIDLLNLDTLEFTPSRMDLPPAPSLYSTDQAPKPKDLAAYEVLPVCTHPLGTAEAWTCAGYAVAALSRDATSVRLEVFDPNGGIVEYAETEVPQYVETGSGGAPRRSSIPATQAAYFRLPGAQGLTLTKFALESLHPPVLHFLSYFGASHFEATAGYRTLFLLPDSFLAMKARAKQGRPVEEFFASIVFMIPGLILALLLSWRVDRDGGRLGLPKNVRTAWVAGTIVFGLPVYITYRLTRPKATLVTCANCGLGRRPDMEKCQRCGSAWSVPELTPPAWRVIGEPEPAADRSPAPVQQADSSAQ